MIHEDYIALKLGILISVRYMKHVGGNQFMASGIPDMALRFGKALECAMKLKNSTHVNEIIVISQLTGKHLHVINNEDDAIDALLLASIGWR
jgi:hypothetical protein